MVRSSQSWILNFEWGIKQSLTYFKVQACNPFQLSLGCKWGDEMISSIPAQANGQIQQDLFHLRGRFSHCITRHITTGATSRTWGFSHRQAPQTELERPHLISRSKALNV